MSDWEFSDDFAEAAQKKSNSLWDTFKQSVLQPVTDTTAVIGEGAVHALPDTIGFFGDVAHGLYTMAKDPMHGTTLKDIKIPGLGPASEAVGKSFDEAEDLYTKGNTPRPKTRAQQYLNTASRGAADVLLGGGPENVGRAIASGASGGLSAEAVYEATGDKDLAALAAIIGGGTPEVLRGGIRSANTARMIRGGSSLENFGDLISTIKGLEGGGTLENPRVSPKGAMGVMQVMPDTARKPGFGIRPWDGKSQADLQRVGVQYAAALNHKYGGDTAKVLAAYNAGPGRVDALIAKHGDDWKSYLPKETRDYVHNGIGTDEHNIVRTDGEPYVTYDQATRDLNDYNDALANNFEDDFGPTPDDAHLDYSDDFFANEINRRQNEDPNYELTSAEKQRIQEMVQEDPSKIYNFPNITFGGPDGMTMKFDPEAGGFVTNAAIENFPKDKLPELTPDEIRDLEATGKTPADVTRLQDIRNQRTSEAADAADAEFARHVRESHDMAQQVLEHARAGDPSISLRELEDTIDYAYSGLPAARAKGHGKLWEQMIKALEEAHVNMGGKSIPEQPYSAKDFGAPPAVRPEAVNDGPLPPELVPPAKASPLRRLIDTFKAMMKDESGAIGKPPEDEGTPPPREPPESPKYAGNVNLERLKTTKAMEKSIREAAAILPPNEVQSHDATVELARELGFSSTDELISHNPTLSELPGYALSLRNHLVESARSVVALSKKVADKLNVSEADREAFAQAWIRHVALQEQASKMAGTAGRLLDSYNIIAKGGKDYRSLKDMPRILGDETDVSKLAEMIAEHADDPAAISKLTRDAMKPKAEDYIFSLRYNMMLSGIKTHFANIFGNTSNLMLDLADHGLASIMGQRRRLSPEADRVAGREVLARTYGMLAALKTALPNMKLAFKLGSPLDLAGRTEFRSRTFTGPLGVIETPTRALAAEDEFFRTVAQLQEIYGQAARTAVKEGLSGKEFWDRVDYLSKNPTPEMESIANDYAKRMRFQDAPSWLGRWIESGRHAQPNDTVVARAGRMALRIALPFIRTPDSLLRTAIRNSPLGVLDSVNIRDFKAGGARRDLAISRVALGSALTYAFAKWAEEGGLTGAGPDDPKKKQELLASGWQPYSIHIGDHYYSISQLQPISTIMAAAATAVEQLREGGHDDKSFMDEMTRITMGTASAVTDNAWLENVSDLLKAKDNGPAGLANYLSGIAASFAVPGIVRQVNQGVIDPTVRDTSGNGSMQDRILGRVESGIPSLSKDLPARHDVLGREVHREGGLLSVVSPVTVTSKDQSAIDQELQRLSGNDKSALVTPVGKVLKVDGQRKFLNAKEFQEYQELSGKKFMEEMSDAMDSFNWDFMSDTEQRKEVKKLLAKSRKEARNELFSSSDDPFADFK